MAVNLLEMLQGSVAPALVRDASRFLGETETNTQAAVGSLLPALLGSFAQKSATPGGAADLLKLISGPGIDTNLVSSLGAMLGGGQQTNDLLKMGTGLVTSLMGDKTGAFNQALSSASGMKTSSVTNLLALALPVIFAFLKKYVMTNKVDAGGLASLLMGQKDVLAKTLDSRLTTALGLGSPAAFLASLGGKAADAGAAVSGAARQAGAQAATAAGATAAAGGSAFKRWLPWIVLAAILAMLLPQLTQCGKQPAVPKVEAPKVTTAPAAPAAPAAPVVTSDNATVYFAVGAATLPDDAAKTLDPVINKLKLNAGTKALISGYHSATGELATNQELAKNRAMAVHGALKAAGIAEDRLMLDKPLVAEANLAGEDPKARRVEVAVK